MNRIFSYFLPAIFLGAVATGVIIVIKILFNGPEAIDEYGLKDYLSTYVFMVFIIYIPSILIKEPLIKRSVFIN